MLPWRGNINKGFAIISMNGTQSGPRGRWPLAITSAIVSALAPLAERLQPDTPKWATNCLSTIEGQKSDQWVNIMKKVPK
jgi:hypothetical protein